MRHAPLFPAEVTSDVPRITLIGTQEARVEQHKGLVTYQSDEVTFKTAQGTITLTGRDLRFLQYTAQEATVGGMIEDVKMRGRETVK